MNGVVVETVASSWIEALGGLSQMYMRNVPPCFWASDGPAASSVSAADAAATARERYCMIVLPWSALFACAFCAPAAGCVDGTRFTLSCVYSMSAAAPGWQALRW